MSLSFALIPNHNLPRPVSALRPERNVALDFFRAIALITIFINHIPFNLVYWATPSRFALCDATDIFIFIAGYASALAYGRRYDSQGFKAGTRMVLSRCGHIYGAHLWMFALLATLCVVGNLMGIGPDYILSLNIAPLFDNTLHAVIGLASLTYVPNYFDILPMYLVLLGLLPFMILALKYWGYLAMLLPPILYVTTWLLNWELTAESETGRAWFFNPLCWQLLFFIGFFIGRGLLPQLRWHFSLGVIALIIALSGAIIEFGATFFEVTAINHLRSLLLPYADKSHYGLLRLVNFMALAYLFAHFIRWQTWLLDNPLSRQMIAIGQQSLPVFVASMSLSFACGMILDSFGRNAGMLATVNCLGLLLLWSIAKIARKLRTDRHVGEINSLNTHTQVSI